MKNEFSDNYKFEVSRIDSLLEIIKFPVRHFLNSLSKKNLSTNEQMAIFSSDHIGHDINLDGLYEKNFLFTLVDWLENYHKNAFTGSVVDAGANIGNHSVFFSKHFKKVYSFEPNPKTYSLLKINTEAKSNIFIKKLGLSNKKKIAKLLVSKTNLGGSRLVDRITEGAIDIKLSTIDYEVDYTNEIIKLLKIDVEGHELEVMQGSKNLILMHKPFIIFEQQLNDFPTNFRRIKNFLKNLDYENYAVIKRKSHLSILNKINVNKYLLRLLNAIFKEYFCVEITKELEPQYYHFLIAIPNNHDNEKNLEI